MTKEIQVKIRDYDVKAVPTTVIDVNIKVVGIPDFPWICGEDLYTKLKRDYSIK
jgi:hypothetical protein